MALKGYCILLENRFASADYKRMADVFSMHVTVTVYATSEAEAVKKAKALVTKKLPTSFDSAVMVFGESS